MAHVTMKVVPGKAGKAGKTRKIYLAKWKENGAVREKSFPMKRDAKSFALEMQARHEGKSVSDDEHSQLTKRAFEDIADEYLVELTKGYDGGDPLEAHTLRTYRGYLSDHAYPYFSSKGGNIASIRREEIEELRDRVARTPSHRDPRRMVSPKAVREVLRLTKAVLKYAVTRGYITSVPGSDIILKSGRAEKIAIKEKRDRSVFSPDQIKTLLAAADALANDRHKGRRAAWQSYRGAIYLLTMTGIRISELRGFPRSGYDAKKGIIHITQRADEAREIGITKSADGQRKIPFPDAMVAPFEAALAVHNRELVFSTASGEPYDIRNLHSRMLSVLIARANVMAAADPEIYVPVPALGFHAFRHAYVSRLIKIGANLKQIQTWVGHHDPAFTLRRYGHLFDDDGSSRDVMGRMDF